MKLDLLGKRAVVCGGSQGIGRACAIELSACGASITLLARDKERLNHVRQDLDKTRNQHHHVLAADFNNPESLHEKMTSYLHETKGIHILINNCGGPPPGRIIETECDAFNQAFSAHLLCNHMLVQMVVPLMSHASYGRIVNILSTSVKCPIPNLGVSNTIRCAVAAWAKTMAGELGPLGITVNNVLPGMTKTDRLNNLLEDSARKSGLSVSETQDSLIQRIPARRFAEPSEIAFLVAFLASPCAGYINGTSIPVDGGSTPSI